MLLGSQYADNKIYRGIKHYDSMPLTSGDIHEASDTNHMKNAYIMNNLLGYGTMNTPTIVTNSVGLRLSEPSVVLIDGDVSLIQSDDNSPLVSNQDIKDAGYAHGVVCILGWYQSVTVATTLRNYGGVNNYVLENDLGSEYGQISSRYQLRWFPVIIDRDDLSDSQISIEIVDRDRNGVILSTNTNLTSTGKKGSVFIFNKPASMDYVEDKLYLVPIIFYDYASNTISNVNPVDKLRAGSQFTVSETEPTGIMADGARWYNPTTREFKTYVSASGGFVDTASKMAFLQYQSIYTIDQERISPQNVVIPIDVNSFQEGDILRVIYEGLELAKTLQYTIDYTAKTVTLLNFTTKVGDTVYFTVTRIVEASDITNVTSTFINHIASTGSSTVEAHVKLSDTVSESNASQGVAATPKMVKDAVAASQILVDETTGKNYKFGVKDGNLYVEEV